MQVHAQKAAHLFVNKLSGLGIDEGLPIIKQLNNRESEVSAYLEKLHVSMWREGYLEELKKAIKIEVKSFVQGATKIFTEPLRA